VSVLGVSVPHYWLGMVLVIIFSVDLNWLPPTGAGPDGSRSGGPTPRICATSSCRR
jgi:peptide/nickel transport system permease protein